MYGWFQRVVDELAVQEVARHEKGNGVVVRDRQAEGRAVEGPSDESGEGQEAGHGKSEATRGHGGMESARRHGSASSGI